MRLVHVLRRLTTLRSAGGILVVFSLGVLLPALLLTAFGVSAWLRERQVGEAQIRDELERAADLAAGQLEAGLRPWQEMVEDVAEGRPPKAPPQLEPAGAERGVFVIARAGADAASFWPAGQVLYGPDRIASDGPVETDRLRAIAAVELVERDYHGAIALYRKHLASASQAEGAVMLLRLARVYRKAGATAEALAVYRQIETSSERIGTLPIDLLARFETCTVLAAGRPLDAAPRALALYRDLVGGRWLLEKSRFLFYADEARAWASGGVEGAAEIARLDDIAARKRALTEAADAAIAGTSSAEQRATFVTLTPGDREPGGPKAIAIIRADWLSARVWPRAFARTIDGGFDVAVATSGGGPHYDSRSPSAAATESPWAASRAARIGGVGWTLEVRPRDAAGQLADLKRRRQVYMLMLVSIVALLGLGTFLTGRVVKREIEVARLKADFVSTVSHEFRSPLTGIRQLGEMLARGRVPSEARRLSTTSASPARAIGCRAWWRTCSISRGWRRAGEATASNRWNRRRGCAASPSRAGRNLPSGRCRSSPPSRSHCRRSSPTKRR